MRLDVKQTITDICPANRMVRPKWIILGFLGGDGWRLKSRSKRLVMPSKQRQTTWRTLPARRSIAVKNLLQVKGDGWWIQSLDECERWFWDGNDRAGLFRNDFFSKMVCPFASLNARLISQFRANSRQSQWHHPANKRQKCGKSWCIPFVPSICLVHGCMFHEMFTTQLLESIMDWTTEMVCCKSMQHMQPHVHSSSILVGYAVSMLFNSYKLLPSGNLTQLRTLIMFNIGKNNQWKKGPSQPKQTVEWPKGEVSPAPSVYPTVGQFFHTKVISVAEMCWDVLKNTHAIPSKYGYSGIYTYIPGANTMLKFPSFYRTLW